MSKIFSVVIGLIIIVAAGYLIYQMKTPACSLSGGTITTSLCCKATGDFPNTCLIGACGCSPDNSHEVKVCDCGADKCFDGSRCKNIK